MGDIRDTTDLLKFFPSILDELLPNISDSFVLLVEGSKGTIFENVREEIISMLNEHIMEHIQSDSQGDLYSLTPLISEQLLDGIILILKRYEDNEIRKRLLTAHIMFYFNGFVGLMGNN